MNYEITREGYYKFYIGKYDRNSIPMDVSLYNNDEIKIEVEMRTIMDLYERISYRFREFDYIHTEREAPFWYNDMLKQRHICIVQAKVWGIFKTKEAAVLWKLEND